MLLMILNESLLKEKDVIRAAAIYMFEQYSHED